MSLYQQGQYDLAAVVVAKKVHEAAERTFEPEHPLGVRSLNSLTEL